jgi:putative ABC transport system ATP-binding protein
VRDQILTDKRCILVVTHDARIYEFADRILRMEDGMIVGIDERGSADA